MLELLADRSRYLARNDLDPVEARDAAVALTEAHAIVSPTWVDAPTHEGLWWVDSEGDPVYAVNLVHEGGRWYWTSVSGMQMGHFDVPSVGRKFTPAVAPVREGA